MRPFHGIFLGLLGLSLACGTPAADDAAVVTPAVQPMLWSMYPEGEAIFVSGVSAEGVYSETPLTVIRQGDGGDAVVGFALVTANDAAQSKVQLRKLAAGQALDGLVARLWLPEDAEIIATLDNWPPPAGATVAAVKPRPSDSLPPAAPASKPQTSLPSYAGPLPEKLQHKNPDKRLDALAKYEDDPDATAMIIHLMINDESFDVRKKAWRMVRARWKRGTGNMAHHEAAARWMATQGPSALRGEAEKAIADHG